jgi:hypothetical protein
MSTNTNNQEVDPAGTNHQNNNATMDGSTLQMAREQAKVAFLQSLKDQYLPMASDFQQTRWPLGYSAGTTPYSAWIRPSTVGLAILEDDVRPTPFIPLGNRQGRLICVTLTARNEDDNAPTFFSCQYDDESLGMIQIQLATQSNITAARNATTSLPFAKPGRSQATRVQLERVIPCPETWIAYICDEAPLPIPFYDKVSDTLKASNEPNNEYFIRWAQALATAQSDANRSRSQLALTCEPINPLALPETDEVLHLINNRIATLPASISNTWAKYLHPEPQLPGGLPTPMMPGGLPTQMPGGHPTPMMPGGLPTQIMPGGLPTPMLPGGLPTQMPGGHPTQMMPGGLPPHVPRPTDALVSTIMTSDRPQAEKQKMLETLIALGQTPVYLPPPPLPLQDPTNSASKLGNRIWNIKGWCGMAVSDELPLFWQNFDTCKNKSEQEQLIATDMIPSLMQRDPGLNAAILHKEFVDNLIHFRFAPLPNQLGLGPLAFVPRDQSELHRLNEFHQHKDQVHLTLGDLARAKLGSPTAPATPAELCDVLEKMYRVLTYLFTTSCPLASQIAKVTAALRQQSGRTCRLGYSLAQ